MVQTPRFHRRAARACPPCGRIINNNKNHFLKRYPKQTASNWVLLLLFNRQVLFGCSATPWIARQASLSFSIPQSLLRSMPTESPTPSSRLTLCRPLLLLPSVVPASGSFQMSHPFASGGRSVGASASVLPTNIHVLIAGICDSLSEKG